MNAEPDYTRTAIALHWLLAVLIFGGFGLGLYMHDLPFSPQKLKLYSWHKWIGVSVFLLVLIRGVWRITHSPPPLPPGMPAWQRFAAHISHGGLYLLMFVIPLSGWLMSSASGFKVVYFGVIPLPDLLDKNKAVAEVLVEVHEILAFTLVALVVVHAAAAIKHQFIDHDGTLMRMFRVGRGG